MLKKTFFYLLLLLLFSCGRQVKDDPGIPVNPDAEKIIKEALKLLDRPYQKGGTGNPGFDCSGFVQYVFEKNGVSLPRTCGDIYTKGSPVNKGKEKPGDIIFFAIEKKGRASHVGIVYRDGKMIHSNSSGGSVRISIYKGNNYWEKYFLGIRRIAK